MTCTRHYGMHLSKSRKRLATARGSTTHHGLLTATSGSFFVIVDPRP